MCKEVKNPPHDYGQKLYGDNAFHSFLFPDFAKHQGLSAKIIWDRVLSRTGSTPKIDQDPDLPTITHAIDYGCGEATFLNEIATLATEAKSSINFTGLDCSEEAIQGAKLKYRNLAISSCDRCPVLAFAEMDKIVDWSKTALMIMGHSWFHFDQDCLIQSILKYRPALLLVDVFSSWDHVVEMLRSNSGCKPEHGRTDSNGDLFFLKSERINGGGKMKRGLFKIEKDGEGKWFFETEQAMITTPELFGGVHVKFEQDTAETILRKGRTNGMLRDSKLDENSEVAYIQRRGYHHETGWGPMDCHVLICRDAYAEVLNEAYQKTIRKLISDVILTKDSKNAELIERVLSLFNDPQDADTKIVGSREALLIEPFDPNLTFARILSLFDSSSEIAEHPLLVEHPSRFQCHYPSANGVFQTCLTRSSSAQAFPVKWAPDYDMTLVDWAIEELEVKVLGLNDEGFWGSEQSPASYFMVPFYFGSLPLFCLALKFPKHFDPATTAFEVFYSSIKSLHDTFMVLITDEVLAVSIVRPWLEEVLYDSRWSSLSATESGCSVGDKLNILQDYLFGRSPEGNDDSERCSTKSRAEIGVVNKGWKSWILGLPSFRINKMAKVIEENRRLWQIWENEKEIALLDPALRISLWFQDGKFFEDKAHNHFNCAEHLPRLKEMLSALGSLPTAKNSDANSWFPNAVAWLKNNYENESGSIARHFGTANTKHFLFHWLVKQLKALSNAVEACKQHRTCDANGTPTACSADESFQALKAVFCKTNANTGPGVRFDLRRLWHLLDAARRCDPMTQAGTIEPTRPDNLKEPSSQIPAKFWSKDDPSILIAEFVNCLARMKCSGCSILQKIELTTHHDQAELTLLIKIELKENVGGSEKHQLDQCANEIRKHCALEDIHGTQRIKISFSVNSEGKFKPGIQS